MCGRTACTLAPDEIVRACSYRDRKGKRKLPEWKDAPGGKTYFTSYNMAPGAHTPVLVSSMRLEKTPNDSKQGPERVIMPMKWGLTPPWHRDDPYKIPYETNNCRVEGMTEKKTYKIPLEKGNRCVVLMDGYYEWKTAKDGKQPYFFHFPQPGDVKFPVTQDSKAEIKLKKYENMVKSEFSDCKNNVKVEVKETIPNAEIDPGNGQRFGNIKAETNFKHIKSEDSNSSDKISFSNENSDEKSSFWDVQKSDEKSCLIKQEQLEKESQCCDDLTRKEPVCKKRKFEEDMVDDDSEDTEWQGQRLLTVAGVFDIWRHSKDSTPLYSYSIITVPSSDSTGWCHHRMPAILSSDDEVNMWLDSSEVPLKKACGLITPKEGLSFYPVSKSVNNSRYQGSDCVKEVDLSKPKSSPASNFMMKWLKSAPPSHK